MTTTIETSSLDKALRTLKPSGMLATSEARLAQACAGELGHTGLPPGPVARTRSPAARPPP